MQPHFELSRVQRTYEAKELKAPPKERKKPAGNSSLAAAAAAAVASVEATAHVQELIQVLFLTFPVPLCAHFLRTATTSGG